MDVPFRKRSMQRRLRDAFARISFGTHSVRKSAPGLKFSARIFLLKVHKTERRIKYAVEDAVFFVRKAPRHVESIMFAFLVMLAGAMLLGSRGGSFLDSLVAFLLLVLVVVLFSQLKMQRRMLSQYVPMIDFLRVRECRLYSDRLRVANVFGVKENLDKVRHVRNIRIKYDIVNDSFCPVSIEGVALVIKLKNGKITMPPAISVLDLAPKKSGGTTVEFRLRDDILFDAIEWLEVDLRGNCRKKERVKPHLYVNAMMHGKIPRLVFEPLESFLKRPEFSDNSVEK